MMPARPSYSLKKVQPYPSTVDTQRSRFGSMTIFGLVSTGVSSRTTTGGTVVLGSRIVSVRFLVPSVERSLERSVERFLVGLRELVCDRALSSLALFVSDGPADDFGLDMSTRRILSQEVE